MARKTAKFVPVRNEELHVAMLAKRSSSAASPHKDARTKRVRTRQAATRSAIRDSY